MIKGISEYALKAELDYESNGNFPLFITAAGEAGKFLKIGDIITVTDKGKLTDFIYNGMSDWAYVETSCGKLIDSVNIVKVNGEWRLFGFRRYAEDFRDKVYAASEAIMVTGEVRYDA